MTDTAVFFDRDGVLIENRPDHVKSWSEVVPIPGAAQALAALSSTGLRLFVVTNQAIVGRGLVPRETVDDINRRLAAELADVGAIIEAVLVCPHTPEDACACRKPQAGLLLDAANTYGVDLARSFMVGDAESDIVAGRRAGCECILVLTGRGADQARAASWVDGEPSLIAHDAVDAAIWILGRLAERARPAMEVIRP